MSAPLSLATDVQAIGGGLAGEHAAAHTNQHGRMGAIFERARLLAVETAAAQTPTKTARPEDIR